MAQEELQKTPNGVSVQGKLRLRNGLHARPAARLAKEAQRYRSTIRLVTDAGEADCKSMLDILSLALPAEGEFLGGHGTSLAGIIVDGGRFDYAASGRYPWLTEPDPSYHGLSYTGIAGKAALITYIRAQLLRDEGPCLSPFNCFLILQGLETLSLRVERHVENALKVIDYLKTCPLVEKIHHPSLPDSPDHALYERYFPKGAGSIFLVDLKGGAETAVKFVDSLKLFSLLANVADTKSLVIHPASTTHSQMPAGEQLKAGIIPGSVRFSIGIENAEDIIADLDQAFRACGD